QVCIQRGEKPQKVYSGKITLRIPPKIHADIATAAANANTSLNKWVSKQLEQVVHVH
ncbi:MAG TPA: toxin-antitoxin system HicB family antitoxin, partial [Candidatus Lambdaproteobacteria bacterium]|nr:toxin-antitoxin system HicB family antitoxin [Candidatus Lambdaproteobacteria bacterium]